MLRSSGRGLDLTPNISLWECLSWSHFHSTYFFFFLITLSVQLHSWCHVLGKPLSLCSRVFFVTHLFWGSQRSSASRMIVRRVFWSSRPLVTRCNSLNLNVPRWEAGGIHAWLPGHRSSYRPWSPSKSSALEVHHEPSCQVLHLLEGPRSTIYSFLDLRTNFLTQMQPYLPLLYLQTFFSPLVPSSKFCHNVLQEQ